MGPVFNTQTLLLQKKVSLQRLVYSNGRKYNFSGIKLVSRHCHADKKLSVEYFLDLPPYKRFMLDSCTFMALPLRNLTAKTVSL